MQIANCKIKKGPKYTAVRPFALLIFSFQLGLSSYGTRLVAGAGRKFARRCQGPKARLRQAYGGRPAAWKPPPERMAVISLPRRASSPGGGAGRSIRRRGLTRRPRRARRFTQSWGRGSEQGAGTEGWRPEARNLKSTGSKYKPENQKQKKPGPQKYWLILHFAVCIFSFSLAIGGLTLWAGGAIRAARRPPAPGRCQGPC